MVEVFKTNVQDPDQANALMEKIHHVFQHYSINFDLEDCDKILRVKSTSGPIETSVLVHFLKIAGCNAEVLPDVMPAPGQDIR